MSETKLGTKKRKYQRPAGVVAYHEFDVTKSSLTGRAGILYHLSPGYNKIKMIEQTEMIVKEWIYIPLVDPADSGENILSKITLDVKKKTAPTKKGIACRFTCKFMNGEDTVLLYVGEDSYVIDLSEEIDKSEVLRMIMNSYEKFKEKFELRKLGTALHDKSLIALDESLIDIDPIVPLLQ